ncbi:SGNH/GDSL hydrolase family protein [Butyrivibrio sp. FCS014]|uniref:SGNH/GDSL hydrolase family protein n=1 Tax=Butyrivibrio sp. FCS014 TaxID=1408304 RepID=UPI000467CD28|nr:SGNH/GDSL hydrolase family protein [Butyrivibrio sp. FCS014]
MKWVSVFKYQSIEYGENIAFAMDQTQRVSFESNIDGDRMRIRFTNRYGRNDLKIERATIGKEKSPYITDVENITFGGKQGVVLAPGGELFCDEINYDVWAGDRLVVSIYFKGRQDIDSICCFWADGGARVQWLLGDVTNGLDADRAPVAVIAPYIKDDPNFHMMRMFTGFDAVQVMASDDIRTVAAFGDSITHMSFYTNALQRRLYDGFFGRVSFINCGIGGNRLVDDATFVPEAGKRLIFFGEAGVKRFERDVFELDEVDTVMVLIGINDIMHPVQLEGKKQQYSRSGYYRGIQKNSGLCSREWSGSIFWHHNSLRK